MSCDERFSHPGASRPVYDGRDQRLLLAELLARMPGFAPDWRLREGDAGRALLAAYARYLEIMGEGLDRLPERTLLAFLDLYANSLLPAQSSRVPLVFSLLPTSPSDVVLPARTTVAAKLPPAPASPLARAIAAEPAPAPLFYTTQTVSIARAALAAVRSVDPGADCFTDCSAGLSSGFTAFDDRVRVPHVLHFGHDSLFALKGTSEVVLAFAFSEAARPERLLVLDWEYLSADGWLPLQVAEDETARLTQEGRITLLKGCGPDAKPGEVNGRTTFWIRASVSLAQPFVRLAGTLSRELRVDDATTGWAAGDVLFVDQGARGVVASVSGAGVVLQQPAHFDEGEILDVSGKASAKVVAAPVSSAEVEYAYPFLAGDRVTVNGVDSVALSRVRPGLLEFDAALEDAQPGARVYLAATPPPLRPEGLDALGPLPKIDVVMARLGVSRSGLQADQACLDGSPLDLGGPFHPFGKQPEKLATFYAASQEAFALAGAAIELHFTLAKAVPAGGKPVLAWEYFDGASWQALGPTQDLIDGTSGLVSSGLVRFVCPGDWAQASVNGVTSHWLRARLDGGDYGHPLRLKVTMVGTNPVVSTEEATLDPPLVKSLRIGYTLFTPFGLPEACVSCNDFRYVDHSADARGVRRPFLPFEPLEDRLPALHFGYTEKLPNGLVSTFVDLADSTGEPARTSPFVWEYLGELGWSELVVNDATNGFTASGLVQWVGPADAVPGEGFGGTLYRVRARLKLGERIAPTRFLRACPNAVWAAQGEQVQQFILGDSDGNPGQGLPFPLDRVPVLPGEVVEVREWTGRGEDWQSAVQDVAPADLRFERQPVSGVATAVWVRWHVREELFGAGPDDRTCLLERATGLLRFGDGTRGRIPPAGSRVIASFATGGGIVGNAPAGTITELRTGVAYLQGVTNPVAASGGASAETLAAIEARGPQGFRHRERSVAAEDYEWLAREASPDVARVRCLPVTGPDGKPQRGWVSLLIAPQSAERLPQPSPVLACRVREFLSRHAPATVGARIGIAAPRYVEVGVQATVVPVAPEEAARVGEAARRALERFLHPLHGGADGRGWQFGDSLYLSQVASLLEAIEGVDYCPSVTLRVRDALAGDRIAVAADAIIASGTHDVKIALAAKPRRALMGAN